MCRAYATPILLLEFGPSVGRRFPQWAHLAATGSGSGTLSVNLKHKLCALFLHFPKLRVIWSPSYAFTARFFALLKKNRMEPSMPADAAGVVGDPAVVAESRVRNPVALEVLRRLPGVHGDNLLPIAQKLNSLQALGTLPKPELRKLFGEGAEINRLWRILHGTGTSA
eukprot:g15383.t1